MPIHHVYIRKEKKLSSQHALAAASPSHNKNQDKALWMTKAGHLHDVGEGVACVYLCPYAGKMDTQTHDFLQGCIDKIQTDFQGMLLAYENTDLFIQNQLQEMLACIQNSRSENILHMLERGQNTALALHEAPFPVIGCVDSDSFDGACQLLLGCDDIQCYAKAKLGLRETQIGLIPAWGGCTTLFWRHLADGEDSASQIQAAERVFKILAVGKPAQDAQEAKSLKLLSSSNGISKTPQDVLSDAKQLCVDKSSSYRPVRKEAAKLPVGVTKLAFEKEIALQERQKNLENHQKRVWQALASVLGGGGQDGDFVQALELKAIEGRHDDQKAPQTFSQTEMLALERRAFMILIQSEPTKRKIQSFLDEKK